MLLFVLYAQIIASGQKTVNKMQNQRFYFILASYFSFAQDFVSGVISLEKLSEAMRLGKLGEQIVLKSPKAFETIYFQNYENVDAEIYYIKKAEREREARREYRRRKKESADIHELFMLDIMREGMGNGNTRLFR